MTGAGFGGCVVLLVEKRAIRRLEARILELYPRRFDLQPTVHVLTKNLEAE
jgi:galactokinase